jgi:hypothetical protein
MAKLPFNQRVGVSTAKPISDDFPESAKTALAFLLQDLVQQGFASGWNELITELQRTGRQHDREAFDYYPDNLDLALWLLEEMDWWRIYIFCERVYQHHLKETSSTNENGWTTNTDIKEVQKYYTDEINALLAEEDLVYQFTDGEFQKRGRAQTQKSTKRVHTILSDPKLHEVLAHYNKARGFFDKRPEADVENCVKEALCALEAAFEILTDKTASKNFTKVVKQMEGNGIREIPPPIAQGMIKLHGYRGSGQGVAHAALGGNKVSDVEAELVLSVTASYITYLYDLLSETEDDDIPF